MDSSQVTRFIEAVQDLRGCADDEELRGGEVACTSLGLPMLWSGNFADVYKIHCPATGNTWALKCFTRAITGRQERYRQVAAQLEAAALPFTVPFAYLERGIQVRGRWFPAVKMQWVQGQTLNRFVEESLDKPSMLRQLLDLWPKLAARLRDARIAHADLQHGNVLLVPTPDGKLALRLIDYDGMWVPSLAGAPSGELGHPAYQHPQRQRQDIYNADLDRFSHLVIYTAVHALSAGLGELWQRFNNDENLLFREVDFQCPERSELFQTLWNDIDADVHALAGHLILACTGPLESAAWLDDIVRGGRVAPLTYGREKDVSALMAAGRAFARATPGDAVVPPVPSSRAAPLVAPGAWFEGFAVPTEDKPSRVGAHGGDYAAPADQPGVVPRSADDIEEQIFGWVSDAGPDATGMSPVLPSGAGGMPVLPGAPSVPPVPPSDAAPLFAPGAQTLAPSIVAAPAPVAAPRVTTRRASLPLRPFRWFDGLLAAVVGKQNETLHNFLRAVFVIVIVLLFGVTIGSLVPLNQHKSLSTIAVDLGGGVKLEMVLIPAGEFRMGSPDSDDAAQSDEKPQHRVRITKPFYLGKFLVTQEQWEAVMGNNPSHFKGPKNPVEHVSWEDCREFVEKLTAKVGAGKFSLPTEAQWEYACRAGSTTRYCFGDEESGLGDYARYIGNSGGRTHPVGEKNPNAWGLYDMHGNVYEWCADWYNKRYYANSPVDDPTGPSDNVFRTYRGGGWYSYAGSCRSAHRNRDAPGARYLLSGYEILGFRVARVAAESLPGTTAVPHPLKFRPIAAQTVDPGKQLTVGVAVENAAAWKGRLRYALDALAPAGAVIDPATGVLTWTPTQSERPGKYDVTVWVVGPEGEKEATTIVVAVTRSTPLPNPIPGKEIAVALGNDVKLEMVLIPAGEFMMGSPDLDLNANIDEKPQHRVRITKPFYLGRYEVTQEQWQALMGDNPFFLNAPKSPVERVSWGDCQVFLDELNGKVGGGRFSLPTEAQWEYACRAGSATRFCFGDDDDQLGEYANGNPGVRAQPVGVKRPNAWGLYDMHGGVREWCADWYDGGFYANSPVDDPTGPSAGWSRVDRGGGWSSAPFSCRSAIRGGGAPGARDVGRGFRVARAVAGAPGTATVPQPLKFQPIAAQTVEAGGNQLTVAATVENADALKGRLRYALGPHAPAGAAIDPSTGVLTWTPTQAQGPGKYDLAVSVEGPEGQRETTTVAVTVTGATSAPKPAPVKEIAVELGGGMKLEMVLIPAGEFLMGSPDSDEYALPYEKPQHRVRITKPFYLGKYLVTQEQWEAVMGSSASRFKGPKNPVESVSWENCQLFLKKLSERSRHSHPGPLPGGLDFRLPTEAEWEYACRAGITTRYCYGDDEGQLGEYAWYVENSGNRTHRWTHPVGEKKPNAWGLYDMHGNVWEWCEDWYNERYYASSPVDDPTGPTSGSLRVGRGGGWDDRAGNCRSAYRYLNQPEYRDSDLGFRVARASAEQARGASGGRAGMVPWVVEQPRTEREVQPRSDRSGQ